MTGRTLIIAQTNVFMQVNTCMQVAFSWKCCNRLNVDCTWFLHVYIVKITHTLVFSKSGVHLMETIYSVWGLTKPLISALSQIISILNVIFPTLDDDNIRWALYIHTTFSYLDSIARSHSQWYAKMKLCFRDKIFSKSVVFFFLMNYNNIWSWTHCFHCFSNK